MTALRTSRGIDLSKVKQDFGVEYGEKILGELLKFIEKDWVIINQDFVTLTSIGKLYADYIAAELFFDTEK
jgi:oxygen-independent coproporphyrinogen-3 oxidase